MKENKEHQKNQEAKKTAGNNQWTSTHLKNIPDNRPRKDGPGGD